MVGLVDFIFMLCIHTIDCDIAKDIPYFNHATFIKMDIANFYLLHQWQHLVPYVGEAINLGLPHQHVLANPVVPSHERARGMQLLGPQYD
jgi:hypothetical protein